MEEPNVVNVVGRFLEKYSQFSSMREQIISFAQSDTARKTKDTIADYLKAMEKRNRRIQRAVFYRMAFVGCVTLASFLMVMVMISPGCLWAMYIAVALVSLFPLYLAVRSLWTTSRIMYLLRKYPDIKYSLRNIGWMMFRKELKHQKKEKSEILTTSKKLYLISAISYIMCALLCLFLYWIVLPLAPIILYLCIIKIADNLQERVDAKLLG